MSFSARTDEDRSHSKLKCRTFFNINECLLRLSPNKASLHSNRADYDQLNPYVSHSIPEFLNLVVIMMHFMLTSNDLLLKLKAGKP